MPNHVFDRVDRSDLPLELPEPTFSIERLQRPAFLLDRRSQFLGGTKENNVGFRSEWIEIGRFAGGVKPYFVGQSKAQ